MAVGLIASAEDVIVLRLQDASADVPLVRYAVRYAYSRPDEEIEARGGVPP